MIVESAGRWTFRNGSMRDLASWAPLRHLTLAQAKRGNSLRRGPSLVRFEIARVAAFLWPKAFFHRSLGQRPRDHEQFVIFGRWPYSIRARGTCEYGLRPIPFYFPSTSWGVALVVIHIFSRAATTCNSLGRKSQVLERKSVQSREAAA